MTQIYIADISKNYNIKKFLRYIESKIGFSKHYKNNQTVVAWYLLLRLLEIRFGRTSFLFNKNEFGKPILKDKKCFFNISHSYEKVVVGISDSEIGIDIEKILDPNLKIANRFFNKRECDFIFSDDDIVLIKKRFYIIWTLKESFLKFKGVGLSEKLNSFSIDVLNSKNINLISNCDLFCKLMYKEIDDYILAYCGMNKDFKLINIDVKEI